MFPLVTFLGVGCVDTVQLARISSGTVGCSPDDIEITDHGDSIGTQTWTAHCHGQKFYCSRLGTGAVCTRETLAVAAAPTETKAAPPPKPKEWKVKGPHWRMRLPGTFESEDENGHFVYHPQHDLETLVFVEIEKFKGDASAYAHEKLEGRTIKKTEIGGQHGVIATEVKVFRKMKRRVSTVVLVSDGDAYALTCADTELDEISDFCKKTFRSFEVDGAD